MNIYVYGLISSLHFNRTRFISSQMYDLSSYCILLIQVRHSFGLFIANSSLAGQQPRVDHAGPVVDEAGGNDIGLGVVAVPGSWAGKDEEEMEGKHPGSCACSCSCQEEKACPACVGVGVEARRRESWVEVEETLHEAEVEGEFVEVMVLGESESSPGCVNGIHSDDAYGLCVILTEIVSRFGY